MSLYIVHDQPNQPEVVHDQPVHPVDEVPAVTQLPDPPDLDQEKPRSVCKKIFNCLNVDNL